MNESQTYARLLAARLPQGAPVHAVDDDLVLFSFEQRWFLLELGREGRRCWFVREVQPDERLVLYGISAYGDGLFAAIREHSQLPNEERFVAGMLMWLKTIRFARLGGNGAEIPADFPDEPLVTSGFNPPALARIIQTGT